MRIFVAGATGAIGRALLPRLAEHSVVGMTRSRAELVRELGAEPAVCDVYDRDALFAALRDAAPELVIHLLTDLSSWDFEANNRIRREGTRNLVDAAQAAAARRLIVESIDFEVPPSGREALEEMERVVRESPMESVILPFGLLWGPHTGNDQRPAEPGWMHVDAAARAILAAL